MLPTADVVNSVIFDGGVATAFADGGVWAQMGTTGATATTQLAGQLGELRPDVMFVDAPVSGSKGPAEAGQWTCAERVRSRATPWPPAKTSSPSITKPPSTSPPATSGFATPAS
jgi:hypothetical protein